MSFTTADLCDELGHAARVAEPVFRDFGGVRSFSGEVETIEVYEDNALVRATLETPGNARVLSRPRTGGVESS